MAAAKKTPAKKTGPAPDKSLTLDAAESEIIEAMRDGEGFRSIAARYGVSIGLLSSWSAANPERHHACVRAREDSADQFDEDATDAIANARDPFELAKARELAVHLRWRAKTRNPKRFGDKVAIGGADDLPPVNTVAVLDVAGLSTAALAEIMAAKDASERS